MRAAGLPAAGCTEAATYVWRGTEVKPSRYELSGDGSAGDRRRHTISLKGSCSSAPSTPSITSLRLSRLHHRSTMGVLASMKGGVHPMA